MLLQSSWIFLSLHNLFRRAESNPYKAVTQPSQHPWKCVRSHGLAWDKFSHAIPDSALILCWQLFPALNLFRGTGNLAGNNRGKFNIGYLYLAVFFSQSPATSPSFPSSALCGLHNCMSSSIASVVSCKTQLQLALVFPTLLHVQESFQVCPWQPVPVSTSCIMPVFFEALS